MIRLSITDNDGNSRTCCQVRDRPSRALWCSANRSSGLPSSVIVPSSAGMTPEIKLKSDVLPAPFGPISPRTRPLRIDRSMLSATTMPPKLLLSERTSSISGLRCFGVGRGGPGGTGLDQSTGANEHEHQHEPREQEPLQRSKQDRRQVQERDGLRQDLQQNCTNHRPPRASEPADNDHRQDRR